MIYIKKLLLIFLIAMSISGVTFASLSAQMERNHTCPVMLNERTKEKFYFDHNGKRLYFCCSQCVKAFKKNPNKYLPALAQS